MSDLNLYQWHRLFDRWQGHHRWQNYDTMKAIYPTFEEFKSWFNEIDFRLYTVKDTRFMVEWGVGLHKTIGKQKKNLYLRNGKWFKLYERVSQKDQWTLDGTIKVMISLLQHGPLARCNLRIDGKPNINKGAKLAWACWLLNLDCPLVVAHPEHEVPKLLKNFNYKTIKTISELQDVYPEPSRAVLLPRIHQQGSHNIDCWTLHKGWNTYEDEGHTQFPMLDWNRFFELLWDWARKYPYDVFCVYHYESKKDVLFPIVDVGFNEWFEFWNTCSKENLIIERKDDH